MMRRSKDVHKCGMELHHHDPPSLRRESRWQNACLSRISGLTAPPLSLSRVRQWLRRRSVSQSVVVVAGNLGSAGGAATVKGEMSEMLMISSVWSNYSPNAWKAGTRKRERDPHQGEREVT